jgi:hypothetical protein
MSSDHVARMVPSTGAKPFPGSGTSTPRLGPRHVSLAAPAPCVRAKCATSRYGMSFELTQPASWKKESR